MNNTDHSPPLRNGPPTTMTDLVKQPELFDRAVSYTLYESAYDNRVLDDNRIDDLSWGDFVELILTGRQVTERKDQVKLIAPVRYLRTDDPRCQLAEITELEAKRGIGRDGAVKTDSHGTVCAWRGASNVDTWTMLPVDIDGQQSIAEAKAQFEQFTYVAYTSFSHMADGITDKFRLFLLLETPVANTEWEARRSSMLDALGRIDPSSLAASRGFYLPSCRPEHASLAQAWYNEGIRRFNVLDFAAATVPECPNGDLRVRQGRSTRPTEFEREALLDLLRGTFLGNYEEWWKVSSAMVAAGYSAGDFKYVTLGGMMNSKAPVDCDRQWQKALARHRRGNSIDLGYLYNLVGGANKVRQEALRRELAHLQGMIGGEA